MKETIVVRRATVYIVILGFLCTGLGVAIGATVTKRHIAKNLPRIVRKHLLQQRGAPYSHMQGRKAGLTHGQRQGAGPAKIFERIGQELNLTSEQKDKVKAILEETREEVKQARDEFKAYVAQTKEKSHSQMAEILDPEQREKFEELTARIEERRAGLKERRGTRGLK
jgi:Spy/CpxP family protein refolding chaperone